MPLFIFHTDDSDLVQIISGNAIPTDARPCTTTIRIYLHSDCIGNIIVA